MIVRLKILVLCISWLFLLNLRTHCQVEQTNKLTKQALERLLNERIPHSLYCGEASSLEFLALKFKGNKENKIDSVFFNTKDTSLITILESVIKEADFSILPKQSADTVVIIQVLYLNERSQTANRFMKFPTDFLRIWKWWEQFEKYKVIPPIVVYMEYISPEIKKKYKNEKRMGIDDIDKRFPNCEGDRNKELKK